MRRDRIESDYVHQLCADDCRARGVYAEQLLLAALVQCREKAGLASYEQCDSRGMRGLLSRLVSQL